MHISSVQQLVCIYGMSIVLSYQIQDDPSLYYNMVAAQWYNMDLNTRKTVQISRKVLCIQDTSYSLVADHPVTVEKATKSTEGDL